MGDRSESIATELSQQQAIMAQHIHPTNEFIPFEKADIEQSIPDRFEQQVRRHSNRLSVKTRYQQLTMMN